ncbi:MAG: M1 family aminopeptidase, partial [Candidatus Bipolaricaulia bacterium]
PQMVVGDQSYHRDIYTWRFGWNPIAIPASELIAGRYLAEEKRYYRFVLPAAWYEAEFSIPEDYILASGADEQKELGETVEAEAPPPSEPQTGSEGTQPASVGSSLATALSRRVEGLPQKERYKKVSLRSATPVRSLAFVAGPAETLKRYVLAYNGLRIEVYYLPGREGAARQLATYAAEILDRYQELYGAYSHKKLVLIDSTASGLWGMAADGFIILGDSAFAEKDLGLPGMSDRLIEWLLAHELAHQWFGIGAGADFNAENFLSEGFAQYLSITYFEEKHGGFGPNVFVFERPGLLEKLVERELGFYNLRQHDVELPYLQVIKDRFDEAIIKPEKDVDYGNWSPIRIYDKGYLVLRALAGEIGREKMTALIKRIYQNYDHRVLTVKELRQAAEEVSDEDLGGFFQSWLYGDDFVDYAIQRVKTTEQDGGYLTEVSLKRRGEAGLPVEVVAVTEDGEKISQTWDAKEPAGTVRIESGSPVKQIEVDPEELTPDVDRLNNFYPMKLRVITTGENDLPLDSYLLRFDPTTQTLEGGTLWYRWLLGRGGGAFAAYLGRGSTFRGYLDLSGLDELGMIAGELQLNLASYSHPEVGSPAKYWEPTDRIGLISGRTIDRAAGKGINYLGAS